MQLHSGATPRRHLKERECSQRTDTVALADGIAMLLVTTLITSRLARAPPGEGPCSRPVTGDVLDPITGDVVGTVAGTFNVEPSTVQEQVLNAIGTFTGTATGSPTAAFLTSG